MKKSKLLLPILGLSIIAPNMLVLANCNKKSSSPVEPTESKEKESRDGDATIGLKFSSKPDEGKADCSVTSPSGEQQLEIKTDSSNGTTETIVVGDDLKANVKVGFVTIPSVSCEVKFSLSFEYKVNGQTVKTEVKDCVLKFNRPSESEFTVTIDKGDHGSVDKESIKVATFSTWSSVKEQITVTPDKGFVFDKWVDKEGNEISNSFKIVNDLTAKATYKADTKPEGYQAVTFTNPDTSKGTIKGDLQQTIKKGTLFSEIKQPETEAAAGYVFVGWINQHDEFMKSTTVINEDLTLRAVWTNQLEESGEYYTIIDDQKWWYDDTTLCDQSKKIVRYNLSTGEPVEIYRSEFNEDVKFGKSMTEIEDNFLYGCSSFDKPIVLPNIVTIGNNFMYNCKNFGNEIVIPASVKTIGDDFLYYDSYKGGNAKISFASESQLTKIGNNFLHGYNIVDKFTLENCKNIESVGSDFLCNFHGKNITIDLSSLKITKYPKRFLYSIYELSSRAVETPDIILSLPSTITDISEGLLTTPIKTRISELNWSSPRYTIENNVIYQGSKALQFYGAWNGNLNTYTTELGDWFGSCETCNNSYMETPNKAYKIKNATSLTNLYTIGNNVYSNVEIYDGNITIPKSVRSIGDHFMFNVNGSAVFTVDTPASSNLQHIGDYCMATDRGVYLLKRQCFLQNTCISSLTKLEWIGDNFIANLEKSYVDTTSITDTSIDWSNLKTLTHIGTNFLYKQRYDLTIKLPTSLEYIPDNFMCGKWGGGLSTGNDFVAPSSIKTVGNNFMIGWSSGSSNFSVTIDFSQATGLTKIGNNFMGYPSHSDSGWFQGTIKLPTTLTGNLTIGDNFLSGQSKFNTAITLPEGLTKIGDNFLRVDPSHTTYVPESFNQDLVLPSSLEYIGDDFLNSTELSGKAGSTTTPEHTVTMGQNITHIGSYFFGKVFHNWPTEYWNTWFKNMNIVNGALIGGSGENQTALAASRDFAPSSSRNEYKYSYYDDNFLAGSSVSISNSFDLLNGYSIGKNFMAQSVGGNGITITLSDFKKIGEGFMNDMNEGAIITLRLNNILASAFTGKNFSGKAHIKLVGESAKAVYEKFSQYNPNLTYE